MTALLLDLFCGAGGAAMGYHRAGFDVVGVDIKPQPRYPFRFYQADAMTFPLDGFDAVHASPPCQDHSTLSAVVGSHGTGWMLDATIERLRSNGAPWVVENVAGKMGGAAVTLCGTAFGLRTNSRKRGEVWLRRHRRFATSFPLLVPPCQCSRARKVIGVYGNGDGGGKGWKGCAEDRRSVMGIDWMTRNELAQAIPPAYTEFVGEHLRASISAAAA